MSHAYETDDADDTMTFQTSVSKAANVAHIGMSEVDRRYGSEESHTACDPVYPQRSEG